LHHAVVERWSRGASALHDRDARAKLLVLLAYLVALATTPRISAPAALGYGFLLLVALGAARLPLGGVLLRAAVVLPFSAAFAIFALLAGDGSRALALVTRSYFSATAVLVLIGTTPLPALLRGLEALKLPRFLILVVQFLYRYLFVISAQAQHMRSAAACRAPELRPLRGDRAHFRAAAGAVSVLFGRSYACAQGIHQAMLARGFSGRIALLSPPRFSWADSLFFVLGLSACLSLRLALGMMS